MTSPKKTSPKKTSPKKRQLSPEEHKQFREAFITSYNRQTQILRQTQVLTVSLSVLLILLLVGLFVGLPYLLRSPQGLEEPSEKTSENPKEKTSENPPSVNPPSEKPPSCLAPSLVSIACASLTVLVMADPKKWFVKLSWTLKVLLCASLFVLSLLIMFFFGCLFSLCVVIQVLTSIGLTLIGDSFRKDMWAKVRLIGFYGPLIYLMDSWCGEEVRTPFSTPDTIRDTLDIVAIITSAISVTIELISRGRPVLPEALEDLAGGEKEIEAALEGKKRKRSSSDDEDTDDLEMDLVKRFQKLTINEPRVEIEVMEDVEDVEKVEVGVDMRKLWSTIEKYGGTAWELYGQLEGLRGKPLRNLGFLLGFYQAYAEHMPISRREFVEYISPYLRKK